MLLYNIIRKKEFFTYLYTLYLNTAESNKKLDKSDFNYRTFIVDLIRNHSAAQCFSLST